MDNSFSIPETVKYPAICFVEVATGPFLLTGALAAGRGVWLFFW
jgi:hypothetical protein